METRAGYFSLSAPADTGRPRPTAEGLSPTAFPAHLRNIRE